MEYKPYLSLLTIIGTVHLWYLRQHLSAKGSTVGRHESVYGHATEEHDYTVIPVRWHGLPVPPVFRTCSSPCVEAQPCVPPGCAIEWLFTNFKRGLSSFWGEDFLLGPFEKNLGLAQSPQTPLGGD